MYKIGELVVHGGEGVCRVEDITPQHFPGLAEGILYYTLAPLYSSVSLFVPVDGDVCLRPVISPEQARSLIRQIPFLTPVDYNQHNTRLLHEQYQILLQGHACTDWLILIKTVYIKQQLCADSKKPLGAIDERYLQRAEEMLYGELAVVLSMTKDQVQQTVVERLQQITICAAQVGKECAHYAINQ